jgi:hypothetical protein
VQRDLEMRVRDVRAAHQFDGRDHARLAAHRHAGIHDHIAGDH